MIQVNEFLKMTVSLFAIVEPIGIVPFFLSVTHGWTRERTHAAARAAALTVFVVLLASMLLGEGLLSIFSISLASFAVGGGLILLILALSMMKASQMEMRQTPEEAYETEERNALAVVPLGVPLLAGPGALTNVIVQSHQYGAGMDVYLGLALAIIVVALSVFLVFRSAEVIADRLGTTGVNLVTRLMGLILAALAVEMMAGGLLELFPGLG